MTRTMYRRPKGSTSLGGTTLAGVGAAEPWRDGGGSSGSGAGARERHGRK
jgi:hypothetical protein